MSQWHRENPEMIGTDADPWMGIASYRKTIEPLETAGPDCYCGRDCEMPCWQRVGIAPRCKGCGCDQ